MDSPVGFGHSEIDNKFASSSGPLFLDPHKEVTSTLVLIRQEVMPRIIMVITISR